MTKRYDITEYVGRRNTYSSIEDFRLFIDRVITNIRDYIADTKRKLKVHAEKELGLMKTSDLVNLIFDFCEIYSGVTFYPYQEQFSKRVIRSVLENDGAEITSLFSRQGGKSETIATTVGGLMIILPQLANLPMFSADRRLQMFKDGLWVGIFAPSQRQAQITYGRMKNRLLSESATQVLADNDFRLQFSTSNGQTVALTNGSFATAISSSDQSNIEGESFKLIILEECQDISDYKITKSIHPMGAAYNSTLVKIGTSTTFTGNFYNTIQRNKQLYAERKIPIKNHFEYDYKVIQKYNPKYAKYVEREKFSLGSNSDEFRMSYGLEWILERGMFINLDEFEDLCADKNARRVLSDKKATHVAGIDLASTEDRTIITIVEVDWDSPAISESFYDEELGEEVSYEVYNTIIKDWKEIINPDYNSQHGEIIDYLSNFRVEKVVIDATRESSVAHRLQANLNCEVIPFIFSTKSKSELYKVLDREIKGGRCKYPSNEETEGTREFGHFLDQTTNLKKEFRGANMVVSHADSNGHDDYPDSWALAIWGTTSQTVTAEVEVTDNTNLFKGSSLRNTHHTNTRNRLTARRRR